MGEFDPSGRQACCTVGSQWELVVLASSLIRSRLLTGQKFNQE